MAAIGAPSMSDRLRPRLPTIRFPFRAIGRSWICLQPTTAASSTPWRRRTLSLAALRRFSRRLEGRASSQDAHDAGRGRRWRVGNGATEAVEVVRAFRLAFHDGPKGPHDVENQNRVI